MHVWDSRRKRMGEEGQSILCQSRSSSAGGLGHGQSRRIWQLIVSQELPERHCHSERTQHNQNTKWHSERSTESFRVIPVFVCQRKRKKKRCEKACREALVITPSPDVTSSQKKKNPQQTQNFTSQLKHHLETKVCVKTANERLPISFQKLALTTSDLSALIYRPSCGRTWGCLLREGIWPVRTSHMS